MRNVQPDPLLDMLEEMARQHCILDTDEHVYNGSPEINVTHSGGLSANASALRMLEDYGRFRVLREHGRMVVGYWPEHDPVLRYDKIRAAYCVIKNDGTTRELTDAEMEKDTGGLLAYADYEDEREEGG